ncbi:uncharacterized protein TRIADDRAFT_60278 [Trichoplax adhaerens]|uniref:Clathrin/coatomer adaptor adaptin-like N-terminal domain-containing protein n=1 Tax=Trichoplax adhaerens TaxID=10228 RepID=B3S7S7_TRIAD|nr:hypothetical protein TRIADDRAFT_60278 [Trichoplax adhaerens]EDV21343.1 hypothetical protein TRIADDRAFT_60278 [Trichoplax adhaerens]|eukprot:XP_002116310.1 hypothetical protein TRIADDRAFT_60278 [Trichoplax adhaerens]
MAERALDKVLGLSLDHYYHKAHLSVVKSLQSLVNKLLDVKSRQQEDKILCAEIELLKERMQSPNISSGEMKDFLVEIIFMTTHHYNVSFADIHAIKFTQQNSMKEKRIGYLAASCLLSEDHNLLVLLINTLQKDLNSTNFVENCMALSTVAMLINIETMPAVIQIVEKKINHTREAVRKRAVIALLKFHHLSAESANLASKLQEILFDSDFSVLTAVITAYLCLAKEDPAPLKPLIDRFVSIQRQLLAHKPPSDLNYRGISMPWLQIKLLRLLAYLGMDDFNCSQKIYPVIIDTLASIANPNCLIEYWIKGLSSIVQVNPLFAVEHQMTVVDCLDDPDETLRRKTLDLLCRMINPKNIVFITEKLIKYLQSSEDNYFKSDLVSRICQLAEKFAPDSFWYIKTMNSIFELGKDCVPVTMVDNLLRLIAEGTEDEQSDMELRMYAVHEYFKLLKRPKLSTLLIRAISWVLGEYAYLVDSIQMMNLADNMCILAENVLKQYPGCSCLLITAIMKLISRTNDVSDYTHNFLEEHSNSVNLDVQQRCQEALQLLITLDINDRSEILPVNASCEDIEVDPSLGFLDTFVSNALAYGSLPYRTLNQRKAIPDVKVRSSLKFDPYVNTSASSKETPVEDDGGRVIASHDYSKPEGTEFNRKEFNPQDVNAKKVEGQRPWTKEGYMIQAPLGGQDIEKKAKEENLSNIEEPPSQTILQNKPNYELEEKKRIASALFVGFDSDDIKSLAPAAKDERNRVNDQSSTTASEVTLSAGINSAEPYESPKPASDLLIGDNSTESNLINLSIENIKITEEQLNTNENSRYLEKLIDVEKNQLLDLENNPSPMSANPVADRSIQNPLDDLTDSTISIERELFPAELLSFPHGNLDVLSTPSFGKLRIALMKVWKEDAFIIVLAIANQADKQYNKISTVLKPSSGIQCAVNEKKMENPNFIDNLDIGESVCISARLMFDIYGLG